MDVAFVFVMLAVAHSEMKNDESEYVVPIGQQIVESKNNIEWVMMSGSEIIMIKTNDD